MRKIFIVFIIIIITIAVKANVQKIEGEPEHCYKKYSITIKGIIEDTNTPASREIYLSAYEVYSASNVFINRTIIKIDASSSTFKKIVEIPAKTSYLTLNYSIAGKTYGSVYSPLNVYRIEDGADIECSFYKDSVNFTGKGSEQLNLQTELFKLGLKYKNNLGYTDNQYVEKNIEYLNLNFQEQTDLLKKYKSVFTEDFYNYLFYKCLGDKNNRVIGSVVGSIKANNPNHAINYYKENLKGMNTILPENTHSSSSLMDFIYKKEKLDFELEHRDQNGVNKTGAKMLLNSIYKRYKGKIRDRLLILGLSDLPKTYIDTYSFLEEPVQFSNCSPYQEALNTIINNSTSKRPAYPFSLTDSTGKLIRLNDFKGKMIVIDFWFTGCLPCKVLAKKMAPIIDYFKGKDVVFITVSIDRDKNGWTNSLKRGEYTHDGNVNLNTNGLGDRHPIITYYNITTYPRMLIIDNNSKLITAQPIRPIDSDPTSTQKFIDLIEEKL